MQSRSSTRPTQTSKRRRLLRPHASGATAHLTKVAKSSRSPYPRPPMDPHFWLKPSTPPLNVPISIYRFSTGSTRTGPYRSELGLRCWYGLPRSEALFPYRSLRSRTEVIEPVVRLHRGAPASVCPGQRPFPYEKGGPEAPNFSKSSSCGLHDGIVHDTTP